MGGRRVVVPRRSPCRLKEKQQKECAGDHRPAAGAGRPGLARHKPFAGAPAPRRIREISLRWDHPDAVKWWSIFTEARQHRWLDPPERTPGQNHQRTNSYEAGRKLTTPAGPKVDISAVRCAAADAPHGTALSPALPPSGPTASRTRRSPAFLRSRCRDNHRS